MRARRKQRPLGAIETRVDLERVAEMRERPAFFGEVAQNLKAAACRIARRGDAFGDRRVFVSDLAKETDLPVKRLAPILTNLANAGLIEVARADFVGGMPFEKVRDSEVIVRYSSGSASSYHFVTIDPKHCRRG